MKSKFWTTDWFAVAVISIIFLFALNTTIIQSMERVAYDLGVRSSSREPGDKIAVIAIDDVSLKNMGRWPWPRPECYSRVKRK